MNVELQNIFVYNLVLEVECKRGLKSPNFALIIKKLFTSCNQISSKFLNSYENSSFTGGLGWGSPRSVSPEGRELIKEWSGGMDTLSLRVRPGKCGKWRCSKVTPGRGSLPNRRAAPLSQPSSSAHTLVSVPLVSGATIRVESNAPERLFTPIPFTFVESSRLFVHKSTPPAVIVCKHCLSVCFLCYLLGFNPKYGCPQIIRTTLKIHTPVII